ncbi:MAG: CoA transferase [Alphaproteobacteria bacterium]|jgi:crotonobetainyl-CoA:carnitine CoA-transferase CaiB-like acyl-CoA transferase|nr:CoA transferase [Alphaproteobacteria bacterium]
MTKGPLDGVKVIEFGQNLAGPYCGQILAFLGAEVIKIERPEGDDARRWGPPFAGEDDGAPAVIFVALNRGKKSVVIDLREEDQRDELIDMIGGADVFVHNLRVDVPKRFGFDGESLTKRFPKLIYANLGAFGHKGPWRDRPGYEPIIQAVAGLMSVNGDPVAPPARVGVSIIDLSTGMWTAIGILAALAGRATTGKGVVVDTSLFETGLMWVSTHAAQFSASGVPPQRLSSGHPSLAPYQAFACADGPLMVCPGNERLFQKFAEALGRTDWITDPRYATNTVRVTRRDEVNGMVEEIMKQKPRAYWAGKLDALGVPNGPLNSVPEVLELAQTAALGMMFQPHGEGGGQYHGLPISFDGLRAGDSSKAPGLGED